MMRTTAQARSQTFLWGGGGGGQIGQIWGPFMITRGLSCDRVEFDHFGGGGGGGGVSEEVDMMRAELERAKVNHSHIASSSAYLLWCSLCTKRKKYEDNKTC